MKFLQNTKAKVGGAIRKLLSVPGRLVDGAVKKVEAVHKAKEDQNIKYINQNFGNVGNYEKLQEKQREAVKGSLKK